MTSSAVDPFFFELSHSQKFLHQFLYLSPIEESLDVAFL